MGNKAQGISLLHHLQIIYFVPKVFNNGEVDPLVSAGWIKLKMLHVGVRFNQNHLLLVEKHVNPAVQPSIKNVFSFLMSLKIESLILNFYLYGVDIMSSTSPNHIFLSSCTIHTQK